MTEDLVEAAAKSIVGYGRVYVNQNRYFSLKVFTTDLFTVEKLKTAFRGGYYPQGKGWVWALSNRQDLIACAGIVRPYRTTFDHLDKLFDMYDRLKY